MWAPQGRTGFFASKLLGAGFEPCLGQSAKLAGAPKLSVSGWEGPDTLLHCLWWLTNLLQCSACRLETWLTWRAASRQVSGPLSARFRAGTSDTGAWQPPLPVLNKSGPLACRGLHSSPCLQDASGCWSHLSSPGLQRSDTAPPHPWCNTSTPHSLGAQNLPQSQWVSTPKSCPELVTVDWAKLGILGLRLGGLEVQGSHTPAQLLRAQRHILLQAVALRHQACGMAEQMTLVLDLATTHWCSMAARATLPGFPVSL